MHHLRTCSPSFKPGEWFDAKTDGTLGRIAATKREPLAWTNAIANRSGASRGLARHRHQIPARQNRDLELTRLGGSSSGIVVGSAESAAAGCGRARRRPVGRSAFAVPGSCAPADPRTNLIRPGARIIQALSSSQQLSGQLVIV